MAQKAIKFDTAENGAQLSRLEAAHVRRLAKGKVFSGVARRLAP